MKKTFDEVIELYMIENDINHYFDLSVEDWKKLMKFVREKSLIEAANNAEADYNLINVNMKQEYLREEDIEVYVLKQSILQLDKNSIEI